jgi:hypothetical protein
VDVPGRNLLAGSFETRPVYFHKLSTPESWGLRDGRWKYIGEIRTDAAELYDLESDPGETRNIARRYPDKVRTYRAMCQRWFLESEQDYSGLLQDYPGKDSRLSTGDTKLAARTLDVGVLTYAGRYFMPLTEINPIEHIVAWTKWAIDPDKLARNEWIAPNGRVYVSEPRDSSQYNITSSVFPGELPLIEGNWTLQLREKGQVRLVTHFSVSKKVKLQYPEK